MDARERAYGSTSLRAAPRPGHTIASDAFGALFTFQTAHLVPAARFCARVLPLCFANPNRGVGGAPRNVRVLGGTPVGRIMTRYARRLRGALRPMTRDARLSALHRGGFGLPGPRFRAPAVLQRRAVALRIRAASSSHPGRSAWRAGSLPPEANGYEPPAAGRHSPLRLQDRLRRRPSMSEDGKLCSTASDGSQQKYTICSQRK